MVELILQLSLLEQWIMFYKLIMSLYVLQRKDSGKSVSP